MFNRMTTLKLTLLGLLSTSQSAFASEEGCKFEKPLVRYCDMVRSDAEAAA